MEIGEGVEGFTIGQAVACAGNQFALHAEFNWVPVNLCAAVPDGAALDQAAFTTIASIALQGMRQAEMQLGETACVIGLGLIGQILVRMLRSAGVVVVGLDRLEGRCRQAEVAGAKVCAQASADAMPAFRSRVLELTQGHGVDCVFVAAGSNDAALAGQAAALLRDRGRIVDIGKSRLDLPWNDFYEKELDVRFSRSYGPGRYDPLYEEAGIDYPIGYVRWTEKRNMDAVLSLLSDGRLDFSALISDVVPFSDAVATYERMNRGEWAGLGMVFSYPAFSAAQTRIIHRATTPPVPGQVRLSVIGAGNYASSMLLPQLKSDPRVNLVEVVTNGGLSGATAVQKFGFARASTDAAEALLAPDIDAVVIATRHASHAVLAAQALRAGKAVFVEKPLALDPPSLQLIEKAVSESGNDRLMVGFNRRFAPLLQKLRLAWTGRGLQTLQYRVLAGQLDKSSWYLQSETEGTRFAGEGGHFIDTLSWWIGADPVRVVAMADRNDADNLAATFSFADGSLATLNYLTGGDPRVAKEAIEISTASGFAAFDNFTGYGLWQNGGKSSQRGRLDKGQSLMLTAFVTAVATGTAMPITFQSLVATTRATFAVQDSARTGQVIDLQAAVDAPDVVKSGIR
ncbi:bi-domain-containing oxidoreductase [Tardiphaga sp. vice154]|uniref:bi-domain-containing oxidoreductase n=1 Tax=Tardiphaga sp. vice154 TaxID=2592814 RepID=UPI001FF01984|nr:bi-domain-containing oxidoreductase [Tardiphaga sp. vice154]